jgi:hypothetical protein
MPKKKIKKMEKSNTDWKFVLLAVSVILLSISIFFLASRLNGGF